MRMFTSILTVALLAMATTAQNDESERSGVARIMPFHKPANANSFSKRHGQGTWYNGKDLTNAACYNRNGLPRWDATTHDMIGAMAMNDHEQCYKCVQITNSRNRKLSTTVMIVDKCAACKVGQAIDLTPGAFSLISPKGDLAVGVLDITWKPVPCWRVHDHPQVPQSARPPSPEEDHHRPVPQEDHRRPVPQEDHRRPVPQDGHHHRPVPQQGRFPVPLHGLPPIPHRQMAQQDNPHRMQPQRDQRQLIEHRHRYGPRSNEEGEQEVQ